jgi:hypothetical protein
MSSSHQELEIQFWEVLAWTLGEAMDEPNEIALVVRTRDGPMALELDRQQATEIAHALLERVRSLQ